MMNLSKNSEGNSVISSLIAIAIVAGATTIMVQLDHGMSRSTFNRDLQRAKIETFEKIERAIALEPAVVDSPLGGLTLENQSGGRWNTFRQFIRDMVPPKYFQDVDAAITAYPPYPIADMTPTQNVTLRISLVDVYGVTHSKSFNFKTGIVFPGMAELDPDSDTSDDRMLYRWGNGMQDHKEENIKSVWANSGPVRFEVYDLTTSHHLSNNPFVPVTIDLSVDPSTRNLARFTHGLLFKICARYLEGGGVYLVDGPPPLYRPYITCGGTPGPIGSTTAPLAVSPTSLSGLTQTAFGLDQSAGGFSLPTTPPPSP